MNRKSQNLFISAIPILSIWMGAIPSVSSAETSSDGKLHFPEAISVFEAMERISEESDETLVAKVDPLLPKKDIAAGFYTLSEMRDLIATNLSGERAGFKVHADQLVFGVSKEHSGDSVFKLGAEVKRRLNEWVDLVHLFESFSPQQINRFIVPCSRLKPSPLGGTA